ncbi:exonuclease domain-containing protein [Pseudonocardia kongjuensis]|uniref:3'-5' exonuclease n=1 Tax=Pseudonocardia kongjuensis TaxID=102227 RepID=UPI0031DD5613
MTTIESHGPLHRVVVDTETTGLRRGFDVPVEIAWWDLVTGDRASFIPPHGDFDMEQASPEALQINGYWARGLDNPNRWDDGTELHRLHTALQDRTFAGSNPHFDIDMIRPLFAAAGLAPEPWHHRVDALEGYARGRLGRRTLPGLARVCELLGVDPGDHTADGDVTATGRCFLALDELPLVQLDARSDDDATRLARVVLAIPDHQPVKPGDVQHGRRLLQKLLGAPA